MKTRGLLVAALLLLLTPSAYPQAIPGAPAAPAAPAVPAAPATAQPVTTIWNKLGITKENCAECKEKCCKSPLGQMLNNMTKPLTFATGGLIPPICPEVPTDAELKKLLDPDSTASEAEKTAAKIKADEAKAAQRRAAIRYLGTVDCHYYPEAEDALISGLRGDRNECVRMEAALALSKGCCCTKKTMAALLLVVNGGDSDGNPSETSERVKMMATTALQLCTMRAGTRAEPVPPEKPGEPPEKPGGIITKQPTTGVQLAAYYTQQVPRTTNAAFVDQASRYLAETVSTSPATRALPSGQRNLANIVMTSFGSPISMVDEDRAFEEAVMTLPDLRAPTPVAATPNPTPPPVQRVEPSRPVTLTAPGAVLTPGS